MAILSVTIGENAAVLRKQAQEIDSIKPSLKKLVQDMYDTLLREKGLGLAAPQVGKSIRLFIGNFKNGIGRHKLVAIINPKIIASAKETLLAEEGCLSLPGVFGKVTRPAWIEVEYQDIDGKKYSKRFDGYNARIVCHETDHLNGVLFIDHIQGD